MNFVTSLEECVRNFKIDITQKFNNVRNLRPLKYPRS